MFNNNRVFIETSVVMLLTTVLLSVCFVPVHAAARTMNSAALVDLSDPEYLRILKNLNIENSRQQPIPSAPGVPDWKKFNRDDALWIERKNMENYEKYGKHSDKWDTKAKLFIQKYSDMINSGKQANDKMYNELVRLGLELEKMGCDDPEIIYQRGNVYSRLNNNQKAIELIDRARKLYEKSQYPVTSSYYATRRMVKVFEKMGDHQAEIDYLNSMIMNLLGRAAGDAMYFDGNQRQYWKMIPSDWDLGKSDWKAGFVEVLVETIKTTPNLDPWISHMILGKYAIKRAWDARGNGYANTVTAEGWAIFHKEISKARVHFTKAHALHPEFPEAATLMIVVSMADSETFGKKESRFWFDRAVRAHFDYIPAYNKLLYSMMPRWRGSHEAMYAFGIESIKTERFDTNVPRTLINALWYLRDDFTDWKEAYKYPGVYLALNRFFEGVLAEPSKSSSRNYWMTHQAIASWAAGKYWKAKRVFDALGTDVVRKVFEEYKAYPDMTYADIELRTGPFAKDFDRAERMFLDDRYSVSQPIYLRLLKQVDAGSKSAMLLERRITVPKLLQAAQYLQAVDAKLARKIRFATRSDASLSQTYSYVLSECAENGYADVVKALLAAGADVNKVSDGYTPLYWASNNGRVETVKILLEAKSDPDVIGRNGCTSLYTAAQNGHVDVVKLLLKFKADPELKSIGYTALHVSSQNGHIEIVKILIQAGVDVNTKVGSRSALSFAESNKRTAVIKLLKQHGAVK